MNDDVALMQSVKAGCKESFEKLVLKYRTNAISFAMKYVKTRETAEDIVQDSASYMFTAIGIRPGVHSKRTCSEGRNKCIDFAKQQACLHGSYRGRRVCTRDIFMCASKDIFKCTSGMYSRVRPRIYSSQKKPEIL